MTAHSAVDLQALEAAMSGKMPGKLPSVAESPAFARPPTRPRMSRTVHGFAATDRPVPLQPEEPFWRRNWAFILGGVLGLVIALAAFVVYGQNIVQIFTDGQASGALNAPRVPMQFR